MKNFQSLSHLTGYPIGGAILLMAAIATVLLLPSGCSRKPTAPAQGKARGTGVVVPVLTARVEARDIPIEVRGIGNVQAFSSVGVRSRITGEILKVHFTEGQEVKAGDLLFSIDPRPAQAVLNQVQANVTRDEAQLQNAQVDFGRVKRLFDTNIASRDEYDKAQTAVRALEATLLSDRAAVSNALLNVGYTEIRSPLDGQTGAVAVKEGNIVKAEDDRLVTINQIHPVYVAFSVPEEELSAIRRRMKETVLPVLVNERDLTNTLAEGQLSFIDNAVDPATGTILLKGTFANYDNALWPGQFLQTRLTVNTLPRATVVPSQAIQSSQTGEFVFVVRSDATVEKRPVTLGLNREGMTVVQNGLQPGEIVVTDGQLRLAPGSKVRMEKSGSAPALSARREEGL